MPRSTSMSLVSAVAMLLAPALPIRASAEEALVVWSKAVNTAVVGLNGHAVWDPAAGVTISGELMNSGGVGCGNSGAVANADELIVTIVNPTGVGINGARTCPSGDTQFTVTPGTDAQGKFAFTMRGGGVSFHGSINGVTAVLGSYVKLEFHKGLDTYFVRCGDSTTYTVLGSSCPESPGIYGRLASPDLNGDLFVDAGDIAGFTQYFGLPYSLQSGWQADFNNDGACDSQDLAYLAGRLAHDCVHMKVGDDYAMDIRNLSRPEVQQLLAQHNLTATDMISAWDQMGLTYAKDLVAAVLAGRRFPTAAADSPWGSVKQLYR